jgi:hypothetical protein
MRCLLSLTECNGNGRLTMHLRGCGLIETEPSGDVSGASVLQYRACHDDATLERAHQGPAPLTVTPMPGLRGCAGAVRRPFA